MDFNEFKRKYTPAVEPGHVDRDSGISPQETEELPEENQMPLAEANGSPTVEIIPPKPADSHHTFSSDTLEGDTGEEIGGFFSGSHDAGGHRHTRLGWHKAISIDRLPALPWVDIIMLLLTIIEIIWVIVNFDAITLIIASAIGKLLQSLIGLLLIAALIVGLVLIFSRRRHRFF